MKMVKNITIVAFAASLMFGSVSFHINNTYSGLDGTTAVNQGWGATWALNESTGLGYDENLGMLFYFQVPAGVQFRMSTQTNSTGLGLGYTWWTGGTGLKTSISTSYDPIMNAGGVAGVTEEMVSVTVGFGF